jgi:hypothetical protein
MPVTPDFAVVNCEPTVIAFIFASFRPRGTCLILLSELLILNYPRKMVKAQEQNTIFFTNFSGFFCRFRKLTSEDLGGGP